MAWLLQAPTSASAPTGQIFRTQQVQGHVLVDTWGEADWFKKQGYTDVTPEHLRNMYTPPSRLLVVRHGGIGDLLMLTPLLRAIKTMWPKCHVSLYGVTPNFPILQGNPHVDEYILNWPLTDGARMYDLYDEVFDLTHSIEICGPAQVENNYHLTLGRYNFRHMSGPLLPEIYLTQTEKDAARDLFTSLGVFGPRRRIVGLSLRASSPLRSIAPKRILEIIDLLSAEPDVAVVLYGDTLKKSEQVMPYQCGACQHTSYAKTGQGVTAMHFPCPKCGADVHAAPTADRWPNVYNLGCDYPLRMVAGTVGLLDLLVTVDTGVMHMAGAWMTPMLVLEAAFDGRVTAGTFKNTHIMQADYPCAPCFRYVERCGRMVQLGTPDAPCMDLYSAEKVVSKARELLAAPRLRQTEAPVFDLDLGKDDLRPRPCPVCGAENDRNNFKARKGRYAYYECRGCRTLYLNKHTVNALRLYDDPIYQTAYREETVTEGCLKIGEIFAQETTKITGWKQGVTLDLGANGGLMLQGFKAAGFETWAVDGNPANRDRANVDHWLLGDIETLTPCHPRDLAVTAESEAGGALRVRTSSVHVLILSHILEHLRDPISLLRRAALILQPRGILWVAMPDYKYCSKKPVSEWGHVSNLSAGEHTILWHSETFQKAAEALGFSLRLIMSQEIIDSTIFCLQKNFQTPLEPTALLLEEGPLPVLNTGRLPPVAR